MTHSCILILVGPKPETVCDFWQMVIDHKPLVLVMLTKVNENGKVRCEVIKGKSSTNYYIGCLSPFVGSHSCPFGITI